VPIILAMNVLWQTTSRDLLADVMTLGKFGPFTGIFKFRSQFGNVTSHLHTHNDMQMNILPRSSCPLKEMSWMMNGINAGHYQPRSPQLTCSGFKARVIRYGLLSFEDTNTLLNTLPQFPKGVLSSRTSQPIIRLQWIFPILQQEQDGRFGQMEPHQRLLPNKKKDHLRHTTNERSHQG
jgi:hypothetical protein